MGNALYTKYRSIVAMLTDRYATTKDRYKSPITMSSFYQRFAIKRIRPQHISSVAYHELTVLNLVQYPRPDAAVRYHEVWMDPEGIVIRMDQHNGTIRRWINSYHTLSQSDWIPIMLGIAARLANAHEAGLVHMDLKPSNSLPESHEYY